jgi:hypothetical protein
MGSDLNFSFRFHSDLKILGVGHEGRTGTRSRPNKDHHNAQQDDALPEQIYK